jgi:hypothetical protein
MGTPAILKLAGLLLVGAASCRAATANTAPSNSTGAQSRFQFGVCVHVGQNKNSLAATLAAVQPLTSIRDEIFWHRMESKRGQLAYPDNLKDLDSLVSAVVAKGGRPLLILDYGNAAYDSEGLVTSPEAVAAFARYVHVVVRHFKGRVDQFEVWNEWNIGMGSPHRPRPRGSPAQYIELLRAAYQAVKAENDSAVVVGGAVSGTDDGWIDSFGGRGGFGYLDAFSVHPYVFSAIGSFSLSQRPARGTPEWAMQWLDGLKARVDRYSNGKRVPIYITEEGWPTHEGPDGVSEAVAAAYVQRFMLLAKSRPWIGGVWWYDLFDDGDNPHDKEARFGLLRKDGSPKPAYRALVTIAPMLRSTRIPTLTTSPDGQITLTGQQDDGQKFAISWQTGAAPTLPVRE